LVVDKNTGRVYIGAVNKLYQLSPNLELTVRGESNSRRNINNRDVNKLNQLSPNLELAVRGNRTRDLVHISDDKKLYELSPNLGTCLSWDLNTLLNFRRCF
jgi:hypothetical protein